MSREPSDSAWVKLSVARARIEALERVVVAYSGGVDSAFLLKIAHDCLPGRVLAVTARSPSLMKVELEDACALAAELGVEHSVVDSAELSRAGYAENAPDRCYFCKSELFDVLGPLARDRNAIVLDGLNADDLKDHRPGRVAADERQVVHPLAEAGLTKEEIRGLSFALGLRTWNKPQLACLSSRLPYGMAVTAERLGRVEAVEMAARRLGCTDVRARLVASNEDMVRLEIGERDFERLLVPELRGRLVAEARAVGFRFVTLDLEGFRSGRMNEGLVPLPAGSKGR